VYQTQIAKLLVLALAANLVLLSGCHRGYYRRQADTEAKSLIQDKATDPRWNSSDGSIEIDPYSRMFNPFSSDHPPIPKDDPASHQLMHCVDGKRGYPHWHANGDTEFVENPEWKSYLPRNEKGELVLTLDRAYQLALLHSPEYQAQMETLYLSALDVSLERFGFETQMFAGFNSFLAHRGTQRTGTGQHSTQLVNGLGASGEGVRLRRLGTTGANYAVGLANTILFNISGSGGNRSATSLLDFSLIQPLLRNAGRDRVMESLTLSERALLANVRQMDRYRRGFYLQVATGRTPGFGPNRFGQFLNLPAGAPFGGVGGFYGLLIQQQQILNQEYNVRQLEEVVEQFRALFEAGRIDSFQLSLLEGNVYNAQASLLNSKIAFESAVDRFVQALGLPPDLSVVIQDDFLAPFQFISEQVNNRLTQISEIRKSIGDRVTEAAEGVPQFRNEAVARNFRITEELDQRFAQVIPALDQLQEIIDQIIESDIAMVREDIQRLDSTRENRLEYLKKLEASIGDGQVLSVMDPAIYSPQSIPEAPELRDLLEGEELDEGLHIKARLQQSRLAMERIEQQIKDLLSVQEQMDSGQIFDYIKNNFQDGIPQQISILNNTVVELSLLQAKARSNSIEMMNVEIDAAMAVEVARCFRRDWMNARANVVDSWRQIEVFANQLESQLDLVLQADMGNNGSNPLKLDYRTGQIRAGLRFDTPLVRLAERNQYREVLIRYQQSRRQLYQFEDEVKRNLRDIVRNLNRNKLQFELNRRQIENQIAQIESRRYALEAPPQEGRRGLGDAAARDLTDAFNQFNRIQNDTIATWVQYEVLRRHLDFDMGTMQLDEYGRWIDPGVIDPTIGIRAADALGIELDCDFCGGLVANPLFPQNTEFIIEVMAPGVEQLPGGMPAVPQLPQAPPLPEEPELLQDTLLLLDSSPWLIPAVEDFPELTSSK
jgi:hypothetical protein